MTATQEEYRKSENCPICNCDQVSGGFVSVENGQAIQNIDCDECGAYWTDVYKLTQYDNLHDKEGNEVEFPGPVIEEGGG